MNIFSSLKLYAGKWLVKATRKFSQEEINSVDNVSVVESQYGNSACFFMKNGGQIFIPLSTDSALAVGDTFKLEDAELLTLGREGEKDIYRVKI